MKIQVLSKNSFDYYKDLSKRLAVKLPDVIVYRPVQSVSEKDGGLFYKTDYEAVNLTKKINETSRIVKQENAMTKLQELEEVLKNTKI